jgi:uncharacterized protein (DUF433 family)
VSHIIEKLEKHLHGVIVMDTDLLEQTLGVYVNYDGTPIILLREGLDRRSRLCILAEEVGHHVTTSGDITDQTTVPNVKREQIAKCWAYECLVSPECIVEALQAGARSVHELAEYMDVTDDFLINALEYLKLKKGPLINVENDVLIMEPLNVMRGGDPFEWITA